VSRTIASPRKQFLPLKIFKEPGGGGLLGWPSLSDIKK